ncbi:cation-translocating P-type ATPase [Synechococcus sp. BA-132 BA5]|uniref:cation-translocating P-type ATPase n=1 Tax=Synechococcus sp. BA-132 BA5 TaxID=3110252 RepID=UPI002B202FED|nr:HAD-IC family P-type ATPase [Synechococcus sp. BA-132 BA5]MEA5415785.1 HAD-IC family P-type ATPase [Synechococcus sp. BA-132 BA5]
MTKSSAAIHPADPHSAAQAIPWHSLELSAVLARVDVDPGRGLSDAQARKQQERFGKNELKAKQGRSRLWMFLIQFKNPLLYILLIAGVVKAFMGSWIEAGVITGVAVLNALIAFAQESKAESAIKALASSVTTEAMVRRNGEMQKLPSSELVPGDLVLLASGDKVPADIRLVTSRSLQVNESGLTGESVAVEKDADANELDPDVPLGDRINMAYAGSFITFGQAEGVVVETGQSTETGRISTLMDESSALTTPLTRKFERFSNLLLRVILGIAIFTFIVGLAWGNTPFDMFQAAVALAVSAIPEGLPAVVTITLAIGVSRMAERHAIVRNLPAVETLGSATIICSDKTGTLTENEMTVQALYAGDHRYQLVGDGYAPKGALLDAEDEPMDITQLPVPVRDCLLAGVLCNDSELAHENKIWSIVGDPTEGALLVSGRKVGLDRAQLAETHPRLDSIPFESEYQYMATLNQMPNSAGGVIWMKGSVESLLKRSNSILDSQGRAHPINKERLQQQADRMASKGLRVLAFAQKSKASTTIDHDDLASGLVFLGLQGMIDPPRSEAIQSIRAFHSAGVDVKMITGDHKVTAEAIADRMNLSQQETTTAFSGQELSDLDKNDFVHAALEGSVFARVVPEQKLRLVQALQSRGHIVAMTGDGVNDAPALKQADIGIAMGITGTEVAKEAADMVLTDDNFASIEAAVEEGRNVFQNLMKALAFLLPVNGGLAASVFLSVMLGRGQSLPIQPLQVLWINMIISITMTIPIAFEPKPYDLMERPPRSPQQPLLSRPLLVRIALISTLNLIFIFGVFAWIRDSSGDLALARTMAIQTLVTGLVIYLFSLSQFWASLVARLRGRQVALGNVSRIGFGIFAAFLLQVMFSQWRVMNLLFETTPMTANQWLTCFGLATPMLLVALLANRWPVNWVPPQRTVSGAG